MSYDLYHIKPTPCTYILHNLQKQFSGTQDFSDFLNSINEEILFKLSGNMLFHTIGSKTRKEFSPLTVVTIGLMNVFLLLVQGPIFNLNKSFKNGGHRSFLTLNISIATQ